VLCIAAAVAAAVGAAPAPAQEPLAAWTKELGLGGGVSFSHETHSREDVDSVTGFYLMGRLGLVVNDALGPGWLRGNGEVLLEPVLIHLSGEDDSSTVGGAAGVVRWIFVGSGKVRPFLEAGAGVLGGQTEFRQTTCDVNFLLEAGAGVLVFIGDRTALTAGYRFAHISNRDQCDLNLGLNSSMVHVGVSRFFP
jgi:hypothetical protein